LELRQTQLEWFFLQIFQFCSYSFVISFFKIRVAAVASQPTSHFAKMVSPLSQVGELLKRQAHRV